MSSETKTNIYYWENRERILKRVKQYQQDNKEKIKIRRRKYRQTHRKTIDKSNKQYLKDHPEYSRNRELKRKYKITPNEYKLMWDKQEGRCAICGNPETIRSKGKLIMLEIDHDHITNKIRGLLCGTCNKGIGIFNDSIEKLRRAISYLEGHKSFSNLT